MQFNLPDVGEGLVEAEVARWLVQPGDEVGINDPLVEVETAKVLVELPSPVAGRVVRLLVAAGQVVAVGTPIIEIDDGAGDPDASGDQAEAENLVGSGPIPEPVLRSLSKPIVEQTRHARDSLVGPITTAAGKVLAKPLVRRLARDLGVRLRDIQPTGPGGSISRADVEAAAGLVAVGGGMPASGVRRATARNVADSVAKHVHVTEFTTIDVTPTLDLVAMLKTRKEFAGLHLSPLLIVAKAVALALGAHPVLNASWDGRAGAIITHDDINLGIAADTPRGLLVPVLHQVQQVGLGDLAARLTELIGLARAGKLKADQIRGGTFTITNIGVFGIDTGTPIINGDEAAILAMGAITRQPWVVGAGAEERLEIRSVMTLALSFDHQMIDGNEGSAFLRDVAMMVAAPQMAMLF